MKIILHPYSTVLHNGQMNPKNFPRWTEVVAQLKELGYEIIQIGVSGELPIEGVSQMVVNWPLKKLRTLIEDCDTWMSVDSFLPHFIFSERLRKRGVVVFSQSSPDIFGHPENINLLKGREFLRPLQYQDWESAQYNEEAFVSPEEVVNAVLSLTSTKSIDRAGTLSASISVAV